MEPGDEIPEEFFEIDEEEEERERTPWDVAKTVLRTALAVLAILGLLYVSGIYQSQFFRRTPSDAREEPHPPIVEGETVTLPVHVFVLSGGDLFGSLRTPEDVDQLVENASAIWAQARITLVIEEVEFLEVSDAEVDTFLNNPESIVSTIPEYAPNQINLFLTKTLRGINGIAFGGIESTVVADFTTSFDYRTLAHEVGHLLGLGHVSTASRLMSQGGSGAVLTVDEALSARDRARLFDTL